MVTPAPCQASWHLCTIEYRGHVRPNSNQRPTAHEALCPGPGTAKTPPASPHRARPKAVQPQARTMPHHDSPPGDANPQMTHHDSPPGDANPPMTQNDSLCHASNPEMTQNDSLCKASMPQMSQNDSHFEVFSFEMTQNDSFSGHKCPTEHPLSVADEPPATPPSPQNDTPSNTRQAPIADPAPSTPAQSEQDRPQGPSIDPSSCFPGLVIMSGAKILTHARKTLRCAQGDS